MSEHPEPPIDEQQPESRAIVSPSQICSRRSFAGHFPQGTCDDCGHLIMAHIGCESCVVCRMEYQLSPQYRRLQQRIHGVHPRDAW